MKPPFFSIITFIKNRADKIEACIRSVIEQGFDDLEYVIQDGQSTDGSIEICRHYAKKYPFIKFCSEHDSSPTDAYFKSLSRCQGQWVGLIMSDETYCEGALKKVYRCYQQELFDECYGFVFGDGFITDYHGNFSGYADAPKEFSIEGYIQNSCLPHPGNTFFNRSALEKVGLRTRRWHWGCGEYEIYLRLGLKFPAKYLPVKISNFSIHETQLGADKNNLRNITNAELELFDELFISDDGKKFKKLEQKAKINILLRSLEILHSKNNFSDDFFYLTKLNKLGLNRKKLMSLLYLRAKEEIKKVSISQKKLKSQSAFNKEILNLLIKYLTKRNKSFCHILTLKLFKPILRILSK